MIQNVLQSINNYFVDDYCNLDEVTTDGLIVDQPFLFIPNQYVLVLHSRLNDGVYKVKEVIGNNVVLDEVYELFDEKTKDMIICSLAIPREILNITNEIIAYNEKHNDNVVSESLGDYSVSYGSMNGDVSWITAFRKKLEPYKKVYLTLPIKSNFWKWWK